MHLRYIKKIKSEVYIYDPIGVDKEGNEITFFDILGTGPEIVSEIVEAAFEKKRLHEKIQTLGKREIQVLELRYGLIDGERETQREIAKRLGISRSYVSRIEKKALRKLTEELLLDN